MIDSGNVVGRIRHAAERTNDVWMTSEIGSCETVSRWIGRNILAGNMMRSSETLSMPDWGCGRAVMSSLGYIEHVSEQADAKPIVPTMPTLIPEGRFGTYVQSVRLLDVFVGLTGPHTFSMLWA